jgi:VCBS repeat-containing protein
MEFLTGAGNDTITLKGGGNQLFLDAGTGDDVITAAEGHQIIQAGEGEDRVSGGAGDDSLDGGAGTDTAVFSQNFSQYTFHAIASGWTISGPDGNDTVLNFEIGQFADQKISLVNFLPTGQVTLKGTAVQGNTLTANVDLNDLDGMPAKTATAFSYQWKADGVQIQNASSNTFKLTQSEVDKSITVVVSYTDGHGNSESVISTASTPVANVNDLPTGSVSIIGEATQGVTLTASHNLVDPDGLGSLSYQWFADGIQIAGVTNSNLTLSQAEVGKSISVSAKYKDAFGTSETVTSATSALVLNVNDAPVGVATSVTTDEDLLLIGKLAGTDIDNNTLTFAKVADPSHGTVTVNATTGAYTYTPAEDFNGTDSFTFKVNDGTVDSAAATVSITVAAVNDAPQAITATLQDLSAKEGANFALKLPDGIFTDVDAGDSFTLSALGLPAGLKLETTNGDYWIKGTPAQASAGSYTVKLNALDTGGLSAENTLILSVAPDGVGVNVKPVMWGSNAAFNQLNVDLLPVGNLSNELYNLNITIDKKLGTFEVKLSSNVAQPVGSFQFNLNAAADVVGNLQVTQNPALSNWTILKTGSFESQKYVAYANSGQVTDYLTKGQTILTLSGKLPSNLSAETLLSLSDMESGAATVATPLGWKNSESSSYSSASSGYVFSELGNNGYEIFATEASNIEASKAFSANDALLALRLALGLTQTERAVSPYELIAADINRDGRVSVFDAYAIAQKALGLAEAPATEFVFLDANADLSGINRRVVNYQEGVSFAGHPDGDYDVALVGVLLGDVNHSFVAV